MTVQKVEFSRYDKLDPAVPVTCITPPDGFFIHSFFDVCPWSPSGRYLVCLRLPFQDRPPNPDDAAEVCIIDIEERTVEEVHATRGWGMQTAAHQCWGKTDRTIYFNDKKDGLPVGVRLDLGSREATVMEHGFYQVSPDETYGLSPCLIRTNHTQEGYGVTVAPGNDIEQPPGASEEDGLWKVDFATGKRSLLLSYRAVYETLPDAEAYEGGTFYGFHVKFNPQGTRIMFVVRVTHPEKPMKAMVVTCAPDGANVAIAVPWDKWARRGHHPNWHPDGERVTMNLDTLGRGIQFYEVNRDGTGERTLVPGIPGSGHPSWTPGGRFILTDAYPNEPVCRKGRVPIRLIDVENARERAACWMWTLGPGLDVLRCDPHPAWDREFRRACFTGAPDGNRQLFIADLAPLMAAGSVT